MITYCDIITIEEGKCGGIIFQSQFVGQIGRGLELQEYPGVQRNIPAVMRTT